MAWIVTCVYICYMILIFLSRREEIPSKESFLEGLLTRIAKWLYQTAPFVTLHSVQVKENLNMLHPAKNTDDLVEKYYVDKIKTLLLLFFAGNVVVTGVLAGKCMNAEIQIKEGAYILRGASGEGEKTVDATAYIAMEQSMERVPVTITVSETSYSQTEILQFFRELKHGLEKNILGENTSLQEVRGPLLLKSFYGDNPVCVSWTSSDYGLLDEDGSVFNEELAEPADVTVVAELSYGSKRQEVAFAVRVCPKQYTAQQQLARDLVQDLRRCNEAAPEQERMELPDQVSGHEVRFVEKTGQSAQMLWALFFVLAVLLHKHKDGQLAEQVKKRQKYLISAYPEFVSKLTLLVNAGMNVRGAIGRIVELHGGGTDRADDTNPCYEEWRIALCEMENGVYEEKAYENLGRRIRLPMYIKLSGLLSQNVKKGSKDMLRLLEKEAQEAFEEKKRETKKLGEEAGTKLLLPMMLMLLIVMILIMLPAFLSYQM